MGASGSTFLADTGTAVLLSNSFPDYPVPSPRDLRNLATNIGNFVVPPNSAIVFEVVANGVLVPGYSISYMDGETGVKSILFGPVTLPVNGTFAIRVTPLGSITNPVPVSALIEIE